MKCLFSLALLLVAAPAFAQDIGSPIPLEQRVAALEVRLIALEARLAPAPVIRAMPAAPQAYTQPVTYYAAPYGEAFGASVCGPGGCGPAQATGRVGLFRRR